MHINRIIHRVRRSLLSAFAAAVACHPAPPAGVLYDDGAFLPSISARQAQMSRAAGAPWPGHAIASTEPLAAEARFLEPSPSSTSPRPNVLADMSRFKCLGAAAAVLALLAVQTLADPLAASQAAWSDELAGTCAVDTFEYCDCAFATLPARRQGGNSGTATHPSSMRGADPTSGCPERDFARDAPVSTC